MPQITTLIPNQQYETVGDRIGEILADEFNSQSGMSGSDVPNPEVWRERIVPMDHSEMPLINVYHVRGDYDNRNARSVDGTYVYHIDCYANAKARRDDDEGSIEYADKLASLKVQRMLGVCRAIFSHPKYSTLLFTAPSISEVYVRSITGAQQMADEKDATRCMVGRLELVVRVPETVTLPTAETIVGNVTQFTLEETELGMRYVWGYTGTLVIAEDGNSFTLPDLYAGKDLFTVHYGNQPYNSSCFANTGDSYTMTNGMTFRKGDEISYTLRDARYAVEITVAEDGNSFTLPSTLANKTIAVVFMEQQAYRRSQFTRTGLAITMTNGATVNAGDVVGVLYGDEVVDVDITEDGSSFTLPENTPASYELALLVSETQIYDTNTFAMSSRLAGAMTNDTTFQTGDQLTAILR